MPVTINRSIEIVEANGNKISVSQNDKINIETWVTLACDSSRCASRRGVAEPTSVNWIEEAVKADATLVPAELFNFIKIVINAEGGQMRDLSFCCPSCLRDYMQYQYTPVSKPKPQLVQKPDTLASIKGDLDKLKTDLTEGIAAIERNKENQAGEPTSDDLDVSSTDAHPIVPMSQPDGFVEA